MGPLDAEALAKIAATGFAGIFAGAATYISAVQHPAVVDTDDLTVQVPFFYHMYPKAAALQGPTAILSGASAIAVHYLQKEKPIEMPLVWLVSGCALVAIVPYTIGMMIPLNNQLMDPTICHTEGKVWMNKSLKRWAKLHNVRTAVSIAAFTGMLVALVQASGPQVTVNVATIVQ
ncbi:hypothetical protein Gpo141_00009563 [Globisporangium polare]